MLHPPGGRRHCCRCSRRFDVDLAQFYRTCVAGWPFAVLLPSSPSHLEHARRTTPAAEQLLPSVAKPTILLTIASLTVATLGPLPRHTSSVSLPSCLLGKPQIAIRAFQRPVRFIQVFLFHLQHQGRFSEHGEGTSLLLLLTSTDPKAGDTCSPCRLPHRGEVVPRRRSLIHVGRGLDCVPLSTPITTIIRRTPYVFDLFHTSYSL